MLALISQRRVEEAIEVFDKLEKQGNLDYRIAVYWLRESIKPHNFGYPQSFSCCLLHIGKKISLDTHNDLLELLAYSGLGDYAVVKGRSQFIEHQALICDSGTKLEFIPANVAERKS